MKPLLSHPRLWSARQRLLAVLALPLVAIAVSFAVSGAASPPNIKAVALSSDPLYATTSGDKPALALALSVEFPTVGAQYTPGGNSDNTYSNTNEYIGYYDAEACYRYNNAPTETPGTGQTTADYKRFDRTGAATNRMCSDGFSGNFLNWSSNSAIDMLRLALSGGDRYIDTADLTVLQRAVIPNGDPICMWNSSNFPAKQLLRSGGTSGTNYFGAVPQAMATAAGTNNIWVANTLNRIYFGTANGGSCTSTGSYNLSVMSTGPAIGTVTNYNAVRPTDTWTTCAAENGTCNFSGVQEVWYGANDRWKVAPVSNGVACTNGVFGDPISGTVKACYTRAYTGTWTPPGAGGLNSDGYFYSRVKVCDKTGSALADVRDYGLCTRYPNGNYKPTGVVQKYSDQLRLSAFGYLMDQTASYDTGGRYGGVLRAPMKYVGAKTFDINGQENTPSGGNAAAEWDASTGVFKTNPDNDTTYNISGVVNYLNKFGRTGPVAGRYKRYDPVSELYYETLRYLQGLQPSPAAVSGLNAAMYDGFPLFTTWTDPYGDGRSNSSQYACLKSNIVVIGDINTHDGNRFPATDVAHNIPNLSAWTGVVGSFERGDAATYFDGQGTSRTTGNPNTVNTNPRTDAIIGYSYWAHTHDIRGTDWTDQTAKQRPGLRVKTFIFDVNEYGAQNDAATRRYSNQFFTAAKYGGFESDPANSSSTLAYNTYGNPFKRQDGTNDNNVWQNLTSPGEAGAYYLQSSARGVLNAFDSIFSRASTAARSIAGGAIESKALTTAGSTVYQGSFDTANWSGDLFAFPVSVDTTTNAVTISTTPEWTASTQLAALTAPATTRNIVVGNGGAATSPVASSFTWATISTTLQASLNKLSPTATADGLGEDRLNYLRGNNTKEGSPFRRRTNKLLGDIINSGVVYSGQPTDAISSTTYALFRQDFITTPRTPAVFVGANDGMLHAFNADNGNELFGYIPSWLGPKLSALTDPTYLANHQSYVDAPPTVAEAQVGSTNTKADWKTVLVSGTGAGGRGVFALDVTNPSTFSASNVMWEFTQVDDADMGYVVGRPEILKMRTSAPTATTATYKYFAVVGSGVNNYVSDSNGVFSLTGNPALFILDLAKPAGTAWTLGTNYYKVSLPIDTTLAVTKATGLLNFKAALGNNGEVMQIFAGDLHGKLWKLDFSTHGTSEWNIANLSAFKNASNVPYPLFVAQDSLGNVQPITMAPNLVAGDTTVSTRVAFGTGKYLEADDRASTGTNTFYVINDNGTTTADNNPVGAGVISGRGRLKAGSIDTTAGTVSVPTFVWGRATSDSDATQRSGWYVDYVTSGERQVSGATLVGDTLIFGSLIPGSSAGANTCGVSGGSGNEYRLNVDTGNGTRRVSTVGIMGQPLVTEIASATSYTISDSTGRRTKTIKSQVFNQGSGGIGTSVTQETKIVAGRLSWRQINNYIDLKNAP